MVRTLPLRGCSYNVLSKIIGKSQSQVSSEGYPGTGNPTDNSVENEYKMGDYFDGVILQLAMSTVEETDSRQKAIVHSEIIGKTQAQVSEPPGAYAGSGNPTGVGGIYKVGDTFDGITLQQTITISD